MENKTTNPSCEIHGGAVCRRIRYLFFLFLIGAFLGWIYEALFYWVTEGTLQNRGILFGPWLPIYGIGTICIYFLKPLKSKPLLLFLLCILLTGVVEYLIGYAGVCLFHMRLWDYRGLFWNLQGIVCLRSVLSFGIMGLAFLYIVEPLWSRVYTAIKPWIIRLLCILLSVVLAIDCVLSFLFRTPVTY